MLRTRFLEKVAVTAYRRRFSGDGGLSTSAQLNTPWGVAVDAVGNIIIADSLNNRIRKVTAESSGPTQITFTNPIRIADGFSTDLGAQPVLTHRI